MTRKRLTQVFPFLLPLRQWQKKKSFYLRMQLDENSYASTVSEELLPYSIFEASAPMVNEHSGFDIQYQYNKVHNLKLAANTISKVLIAPNETFSFYQLVRYADQNEPYKEGLHLVNGKIVSSYGGGLCTLSTLLFWCFLHTPLTIVERHGHDVESFPSTTEDLPCGTDATVSEGWFDLKVRNDTRNTFQIEITFDETNIYCRIFAQEPMETTYTIFNSSVSYIRRQEGIIQIAEVCCLETDKRTGRKSKHHLYTNECIIAYHLPENIEIKQENEVLSKLRKQVVL